MDSEAKSAGRLWQRCRVTVARPPDFELFWSSILDEADAIPLEPSLELMPERSSDDVSVYEIHYSSIDGLRIAGWYCVPNTSGATSPYPGLLLGPGYISEPILPKSWAKKGYASLGIAPRGKLRSNAKYNPGYPGLLTHNIVDRNTYSYRGFYTDAIRAVDFLLGRPEVDKGRIGVHGHSQGGALALVLPALRPMDITCSASGAPYLCGFLDAARLTHSYPYQEINEYLRLHSDDEPQVRDTLSYYDGINFASMIRCPSLIYLGLEDDICPPETGMAAYEAMRCVKELVTTEGCSHEAGAYWMAPKVDAFLAKYLTPALEHRNADELVEGELTE